MRARAPRVSQAKQPSRSPGRADPPETFAVQTEAISSIREEAGSEPLTRMATNIPGPRSHGPKGSVNVENARIRDGATRLKTADFATLPLGPKSASAPKKGYPSDLRLPDIRNRPLQSHRLWPGEVASAPDPSGGGDGGGVPPLSAAVGRHPSPDLDYPLQLESRKTIDLN